MSSIGGIALAAPFPNSSSQFDDVSELDLQQISTESGNASVSLDSNLSGATAATGTGQLALAFASAVQASTTVDPTTGERELKAGAANNLTGAVTNLLMQNGFSADQAAAASASLQSELANGQPISLSLSYDNTSQSMSTAAGTYGSSVSWTAESVTQTEQSGSLNLSIDANGTLNVALKEQSVSSSQYDAEVKGSGTMTTPTVGILMTPGSGNASNPSALTAGDVGGNAGGSGTPAQLSFSAAVEAGLQQLENSTPSVFKNGFGATSPNSPVSESETDTLLQTESTSVLLVNTTTTPANGTDAGTGTGSGTGGQGGNGTQALSNGQTNGSSASAGSGAPANTAQNAGTSIAATVADALKSINDTVSRMLDDLSKTTLVTGKNTQSQLQELLKTMEKAAAGANGAAGSLAGAAGSTGASGASVPASAVPGAAQAGSGNSAFAVEIGFTQTVSIQIVDSSGHGSTLYARPDGSLGSVHRHPTHVTA